MDNDKPIDPIDDLFEPFDLDESPGTEQPPARERRTVEVRTDDPPPTAPPPIVTAEESGILCSACGSLNHVGNRHCDACGARLARAQMPIAPQPMLRTTAGARALIVLAGVVLAVALLALVFNMFSNGTGVATTTTEAPTQTTVGAITELTPLRVECTSELPSFPCTALIDGNPETSWNATDGGLGTEITFYFNPPVQITEVWIENLQDDGRFLRNHRINGIEVSINDRPGLHIQNLADSQEIQQVRLHSMRTSSVIIRIMSAHPAQSHEGQEPFTELAVQSITFYGRTTPGE